MLKDKIKEVLLSPMTVLQVSKLIPDYPERSVAQCLRTYFKRITEKGVYRSIFAPIDYEIKYTIQNESLSKLIKDILSRKPCTLTEIFQEVKRTGYKTIPNVISCSVKNHLNKTFIRLTEKGVFPAIYALKGYQSDDISYKSLENLAFDILKDSCPLSAQDIADKLIKLGYKYSFIHLANRIRRVLEKDKRFKVKRLTGVNGSLITTADKDIDYDTVKVHTLCVKIITIVKNSKDPITARQVMNLLLESNHETHSRNFLNVVTVTMQRNCGKLFEKVTSWHQKPAKFILKGKQC